MLQAADCPAGTMLTVGNQRYMPQFRTSVSISIEQLAINSDEGDLLINIKGNEEDYHIECAGMGDRKLAHNFLKLNSDGNIDYTFEL